MSNPSPLSEEDREELVAYLDGELDEEQAHSVEARISMNPTLRAEAETLKRAWDMLDYLPKPEPSPSFTHRTLDRLSVRDTANALRPPRKSKRWLVAVGWAAALVLSVFGGYYGAVHSLAPRPGERDLVRELRLIENLRYYDAVDSLDFLRELDQRDLFGDDPLDS
jgi:anti-sigma factor RsiW